MLNLVRRKGRRAVEHLSTLLRIARERSIDANNLDAIALAVADLQLQQHRLISTDPLPAEPVLSCACTQQRCDTPSFHAWCDRLQLPPWRHRWVWEKVHIASALHRWGAIGVGRRGLGFGVGGEPLVAFFAAAGCQVTATDLDPTDERAAEWSISGTAPGSLDALQRPSLCEPELLAQRVTTRAVDMTRIPEDLQGFDFCWSACALEHLGTLEAGMQFVERSLACLAPAGVAVHTMELNVMSEEHTIESGPTVLYRQRDIVELVGRIQSRGYEVAPLDLDTGDGLLDHFVVRSDHTGPPAIRVLVDGHESTTFALVVRKPDVG